MHSTEGQILQKLHDNIFKVVVKPQAAGELFCSKLTVF